MSQASIRMPYPTVNITQKDRCTSKLSMSINETFSLTIMCKQNTKSTRESKGWQKSINISQAIKGFKPNLTGVVNYVFQCLACGIRSQYTILDPSGFFFPSPTIIRNFWFYTVSVGHTDSNVYLFFRILWISTL